MLTYTITGDTVSMSGEVRAYIEKRFGGFERFMDEETAHEIFVTASKQTARERDDSIRVEVKFKIHERDFFAIGEAGDIKSAVDMAKEELMREVTQSNARRRTMFHRGARKIKNLIKTGFKKKRKA